MKKVKHHYIITSERWKDDETDILYTSTNVYVEGDVIILDGIRWYVVEVID